MSLSGLLINFCSIEKPTYTKDAVGGPVPTYTTLSTSVPCSIQPKSGQTMFKFGQRQIYISHRIYFDNDVGIKRGYRIRDESKDNTVYIVHNYEDMAGRGVVWAADVTLQLDG